MNYGEARDHTLRLINQYTRIGDRISLTYNEQDDTVNRIPGFLNDAQLIIAREARPIEASIRLDPDEGNYIGGQFVFMLPADLIDIQPGGLLIVTRHGMTRSSDYKQMDDDRILVPKQLFRHAGDGVVLQYYRAPQLLPAEPADTDPLDNVVTAQEPCPYYAAAQIMRDLDAYQHSVLFNEWQDKLNTLSKPPQAEHNIVDDVYTYGGIWNWGVT